MTSAPKPHTLISAARSLAPELSARAAEMDAARRLPADLAAGMAKAGIFRALTPKRLGGFEAAPHVFMEMLEELARANASASWCAMIGTTAVLPAAHMDPDMAAEIFSAPDLIAAGIFAPMGRAVSDGDDYILSGRWPWGSGAANSQWIGLGAIADTDNGKEARMLMVPTKQVELLDTWHVAGLRGTGSGDVAVKDIRVPKARSIAARFNTPRESGALYTFPPFGLLGIGVASVALGNAVGALEEFHALAMAKKNLGSTRTLAERPAVQAQYAKASARLKAARAYMVDEIALTWAQAQEAGAQSIERRAALRLACSHMARTAADVCAAVYDMGGGTVLYETSPIQRRFRDAHAITQHIVTAPASFELFGRVLFEQPTTGGMI